MTERVVNVTLRAQVADYNRGMQQAAAATRTVGTEAEKLAQNREAFQTLGRGLLVAGASMVAATALAVRAAAQWESAWAGVTKTVEGTPEQLAAVEAGLRDLSKVLPATHDEIAAVAEAAGQLGIETDNVVAFTKTMIDLGETTNLSAEQAATSLARFTNIMGTAQSQVSNLGSALVGLGNNYATTESEILEMSMRLAGAGKQIGLSEGDVLGLATALSSVGIEAEAGGSAMSKVMIDIASSVDKGGERLKQFAEVAGLSADDFAAKWRSSPAEALAAFVKGLSNAESQGSSTLGVLAELGITEVRMRDALLRSASAADQFAAAMAQGNDEFEANNALTEEAAKRYETVESRIQIAGNAIHDAAISFGEVLLPAVGLAADAVAGFADFLGGLPGPMQGVITVLTGVAGLIALVGGGALLAVPQVAQFKIALDTLGWSMRGLSVAGGAVGIALTALVTIVGSVAAAQAQARQRAEEYADALRQGEDAAREYIAGQLAMQDSFLWMSRGTAIENAKKLGLATQDITDAVTGSAAEFEAFEEKVWSAYKAAGSTVDAGFAMEQLMNKVRDLRGAQELAASTAVETGEANEALAGSLGIAEGATSDLAQESADAEDALSQMNTALEDVGATALGMGDAVDRAQSAVNRMKEAADEAGVKIDGTNDASIRFRDTIRDVETSHRDAALSILDNGGTLEQAQKQYEKGREAVIKMLEAKGLDRVEAEKWADANLGAAEEAQQAIENYGLAVDNVPETKNLTFTVNTSDAEAKIRTYIRTYDGKSITMTLNTNQVVVGGRVYGGLRSGNYQGNLYEKGVQQFYAGGFPSGIYAGQPGGIHKFAESEMGVPWETYISGRAADRDRNVGIWMETGHRLGVAASAGQSSSPTVTQNIYPAPGMSEESIGRIAAEKLAFAMRGA